MRRTKQASGFHFTAVQTCISTEVTKIINALKVEISGFIRKKGHELFLYALRVRTALQHAQCSDHDKDPAAARSYMSKHSLGRDAKQDYAGLSYKSAYSPAPTDEALRKSANLSQTPSSPCQEPTVAPFAYSVARASKKFACSTPFVISVNHGSGCSSMP